MKQRKKQAKREAKTMLALEQAKTKVQKAEQQVTNAQGKLEARLARLHQLETQASATQHPAPQG
jgi:hypothetical protein